ncbi:hypothetical protein PILCRDRAFT_814170 [Piloderma croceum F 1598]|uniref:Uncharacterized protein n=1 Tax=Piloderma croceum (strain F 1598) TaxID=765440 RepID=A0A0C3CEV2_PILCF|nr:hypothetical protein PILCRDRAFT_814170 [Piloderma croceum F 1598]
MRWTLDSTAATVWGRAAVQGDTHRRFGWASLDTASYGISWHRSNGSTETVCLVAITCQDFGSCGME